MSSRHGNVALILLLIFLGLGALAFVFVGGWLTIDAQESIEEPAPVMAPASTPESNPAGGQ